MANPTPAQLAALIELADNPRGSYLEGIRPGTLRAMENRGWAEANDSECTWHITAEGFGVLHETRDGRAYLDTMWSEAHLAYARAHGPLDPYQLRARIDMYRTMMDSAARLDDAVHWRRCDTLRAQAVFVLAQLAAAVNMAVWQHPHRILDEAEALFADTDPLTAPRDDVEPDAEVATCVHDGRPIARRNGRPNFGHIDERGGLACFADPTRPEVATPLPGGDRGDTRKAIPGWCWWPVRHPAHAWSVDSRPDSRFLCRGDGQADRPVQDRYTAGDKTIVRRAVVAILSAP